ncbi:LysR substrate-binding domain-containing protein [Allomesorhizobium camelthorni]|uniref:LysR family transcriptional regulator n=1 Tax=Allomesorhizobium camelthorni TaxID=475069 RepID=A0A6G4WGJ7_9HYPH|nr:LysR substrate-binding domain-containing protein [Mesorhizobium camelthorni]NGO53881.1 LysR family transcriptional regulator [Mesorhizobium camelthorni]
MRTKALYRNIQRLLPAFEAAARNESFTIAGEEVGLTQSSVSKQIMELERRLGQPLFVRSHKQISLTPAGHRLLKAYTRAASQIIDALDDLLLERSKKQIVISTSTANAAFMLLPRVAEVRECFPGGEIFVVTSDPQGIQPTDQVDLALAFGKPDYAGFKSRALFADILTPVCTPDFLRKNGPLRAVVDLLNCELLYMQAQHPSWLGWRQWLREFGLELPKKHQPMGFNSYYNTIQACLAGQGVALGWLRLLGDLLESGQLVTPLPDFLETEERYHLAWPSHRRQEFDIEPFEAWLSRRYGGNIPGYTRASTALI